MIRPLLLLAALLAPAAALAQAAPATPDAPPAAATPGPQDRGYGRMPLSPEMREARRAMMQACQADFAKFCADTERSGRTQCIRAHVSELSPGCRDGLQALRAARGGPATPPGASPGASAATPQG